ncbi:hypothetical protein [Paeniglutamicibacter antarcticus]|uniref:hypothetical protein n=1 Tax=Paeniglutamicibacter antarcticus TaxID=494023 RepID=UPI0031EA7323
MGSGDTFVSTLVISGESGHEHLRILGIHLDKETFSGSCPKRCGPATMMKDHYITAAHLVFESFW